MIRTLRTSLLILALAAVPAGFVHAAQYDIKTMTPEIQQALENRQNRYAELANLKGQGSVGENNRGYLESRDGSASSTVAAENADRGVIYRAIVDQNGLGPSGLSKVEAVFAEVQNEKAKPGEPVQLPSGEWTRK